MSNAAFPHLHKPIQPDKGKQHGACNRTACQKHGAAWYNISTDAWYCQPCAEAINQANRIHGTLCFPEKVDRDEAIRKLRFGDEAQQ